MRYIHFYGHIMCRGYWETKPTVLRALYACTVNYVAVLTGAFHQMHDSCFTPVKLYFADEAGLSFCLCSHKNRTNCLKNHLGCIGDAQIQHLIPLEGDFPFIILFAEGKTEKEQHIKTQHGCIPPSHPPTPIPAV